MSYEPSERASERACVTPCLAYRSFFFPGPAIPVLLAVARITAALHESPVVRSDDEAEPVNQQAPLRRIVQEEDARALLKDVVAFASNDISLVSSSLVLAPSRMRFR